MGESTNQRCEPLLGTMLEIVIESFRFYLVAPAFHTDEAGLQESTTIYLKSTQEKEVLAIGGIKHLMK